jgi:hypothetical protein
LLRILVSLVVGLLTAAASGAARGRPATTTLTYGHWRVASVELRRAMIMRIGSIATNNPRISLAIAVQQDCTLGPVTLHWKAGDRLDAESYGVLSVRPFAIRIANQPDEVHTGVDSLHGG